MFGTLSKGVELAFSAAASHKKRKIDLLQQTKEQFKNRENRRTRKEREKKGSKHITKQ